MRPQWDNSETKYAAGDNLSMKSTCAAPFLAHDRASGPLPVGRLSEPSRTRKRDISGRRSCLWRRICPTGSFRLGTASCPCRLADDDPLLPFASQWRVSALLRLKGVHAGTDRVPTAHQRADAGSDPAFIIHAGIHQRTACAAHGLRHVITGRRAVQVHRV